ncbi:MAG: DUF3800 domain-containing protein [Methyloceanibacter sp.]
MFLCYIDESGTSDVPGTSSHFILAGLSLPIAFWKQADRDLSLVLAKYGLENEEFHTGWILRRYLEQSKIPDFENLDWKARRFAVEQYRNRELLRLQGIGNSRAYKQAKKNYRNTSAYIHLTQAERLAAARDAADTVAAWGHARLFAECIDKIHFDPNRTKLTIDEQAFEQVVSRFHHYLSNVAGEANEQGERIISGYGVLIHDNNPSVAKKHTDLMRRFHASGTLWTTIDQIIETPLFVDSSLTRMVQIADLCAYSLRRYCENGDVDLFRRVFARADRLGGRTVGVRHFAGKSCACEICRAHG